MITDRMTARVLGLVVFVLAMLVDTSCFMFARPETRQSPRFVMVVVLSSLPMYLAGALLFRKAARMKDTEEDERG
jgi:hypothetical protein